MIRKSKKQKAYEKGLLAEEIAAVYLRLKGFRILEQRFKTPLGEIDIIAKKKGLLVIVEVKERPTLDEALSCVTLSAQGRIRRACDYYRASHPIHEKDTIRFDLIAVRMPFLIRHLQNAW